VEPGAVVPAWPFDLDHRTLRFTSDCAGYRVENVELKWDTDPGAQLDGNTATLKNFRFPFSGRTWETLNVAIGAVTFADGPAVSGNAPAGGRRVRPGPVSRWSATHGCAP
jgi:hypothetical protein